MIVKVDGVIVLNRQDWPDVDVEVKTEPKLEAKVARVGVTPAKPVHPAPAQEAKTG